MIKKVSVEKEKCIHCGMCLNDCILGVLEFDEFFRFFQEVYQDLSDKM